MSNQIAMGDFIIDVKINEYCGPKREVIIFHKDDAFKKSIIKIEELRTNEKFGEIYQVEILGVNLGNRPFLNSDSAIDYAFDVYNQMKIKLQKEKTNENKMIDIK